MNTPQSTPRTVGEYVAKDYRAAQVFRAYGIDFCCGGGVSLEKACAKKNVTPETLVAELAALDQTPANSAENYDEWELSFLTDYIVNTHHTYVRKKLPELNFYAHKVAKVHGSTHPELIEILNLYLEIEEEMTSHMMKEEQLLFPYIKELSKLKESNSPLTASPHFGTVKNPVRMMMQEHDSAGSGMERIQELSNNFSPPEEACMTYQVFFQNLDAFQKDLHKHVHLENNILFPKTIALEEELEVV